MSYEIVRTTQFRKDFKLMVSRGKDDSKLEEVLRILADGGELPPEKRDHALTGNYAGFRECHIEPDWLLIYCYLHDQLILMGHDFWTRVLNKCPLNDPKYYYRSEQLSRTNICARRPSSCLRLFLLNRRVSFSA